MTRALLPDVRVRSIAAADALLLPFLAPRLFAESPFGKSTAPRRNGRKCIPAKKEKVTLVSSQVIDSAEKNGAANGQPRRSQACPASRSSQRRDGSAIPKTPSLFSQYRAAKPLGSLCRPVASSYADIYSFARTQLAHHSTATEPGTSEVDSAGPRIRQLRARRRDPESTKAYQRTMAKSTRKPPVMIKQKTGLLDHRRTKSLRREEGRYKTFRTYLPFERPGGLIKKGRFRSLQRRLYALARSEGTELDLELADTPSSVLIPGFAALDRKVYHGLPRKSHPIKLKHDPRAEAWASTLCKDVGPGDEEVMLKNWETFSEADRNMCWHLLLLYLLDKRTDRALDFIQVLAHGPPVATLRPEMLADALEHIAKVCVSNMQYKRRHVPRTSDVIPIFSSVYRYHLAKYHTICSQDLFLNLARLATLDDLKHIFDLLVETRAFVGYDTLLHYANTFGVLGDHEYALRCLQRILERAKTTAAGEAVVSRARFRWSCALILRKSIRDGQNYHMTTEIVADFLKLGLKLDILLYNIVMHNAIEAGDYETAFRVYNLLEDNGLEPDPHTYSILLHGCTLSDNPAMFLTFAEHAAKVAEELRNTWIATDYLYYLYVQHYKTDPQNLSHILHQAYSRFFSMGPLRPFFPQAPRKSTDDEVLTETDSLQMDPTPIAMYIMLQSEIRKALSVGNSRQVWELYTLFRALVNDRTHPLLNNLAKAPFIWNAFLLAFCRQQQFSSASELIRTMSDSNSEDIPQPDLYSWNIFMQAFFRNDQVRAAERIFEIMRSRGVEPDQFTYKILLRGYAKAQHIDKLGEVVGHLDKEQQLDPEILRILTKVHDRKKLMLALEESKAAREEEANLKRKEEEEEAKRRWERPLFRRIRGIGEATYTYTGLTDAESSERDSR